MGWKAIYSWERRAYPLHFVTQISFELAVKRVARLSKKFKVAPPDVVFGAKNGGGFYRKQERRIYLTNGNICTAVAVHEFAHHLENMRYGDTGHRKQFKKVLKKCYTYAKRWLPEPEEWLKPGTYAELYQETTDTWRPVKVNWSDSKEAGVAYLDSTGHNVEPVELLRPSLMVADIADRITKNRREMRKQRKLSRVALRLGVQQQAL